MAEPAPVPAETGPLHAIAPDGRQVEIRPEKAAEAAGAGYQIQTPEQFAAAEMARTEGLTGAAKAFGESALSAGSLGLSDVAAGAIGGDEYRKNRALRELAFPTATAAGTAAGVVAPALLSGGESLLGSAARASPAGLAMRLGRGAETLVGEGLAGVGLTGESLAGRIATGALKSAASGAVEGAAFGAGQELSEAALAPGGDYDGLAQKLWAGAINGAEFGGLAGGGIGALGEAGGAIAQKIGGAVEGRQFIRDAADAHTLKSAGLTGSDLAKMAPEERAFKANLLRKEEGIGLLDSVGDVAKKIEEGRAETGKVLGDMRAKLDEIAAPGEGPNLHEILNKVDERVAEIRGASATREDIALANKLERNFDPLREKLASGSQDVRTGAFNEVYEIRNGLDKRLKAAFKKMKMGEEPTQFESELMAVRRDLETEYERAADGVMHKASPEFAQAYSDAKARYGAMKELGAASKRRAGQLAGQRDFGLTDTMAAIGGAQALGPTGVLMGVANKVLRSQQMDRVVGHLLDQIATIDGKISGSVTRWVDKSRRAAKDVVGGAIGEGAAIDVGGGLSTRKERVSTYYRKLAAVEREYNAPEGTLVSIPGAPKTQAAAESARKKAAEFLLKNAPRPPALIGHPLLARMARQTPPNDLDVLRWMRQVKVVEEPLSVLHALEHGRLTTDQVDALRETSPALLDQIRQEVVKKVTDKDSDLSYSARIQLGTLLDVETDPSLKPEVIASAQDVYAQARAEEQAQQQGNGPTQSVPGHRPRGTTSRVDMLEEGAAI